ncbi:MAG: hypothetical protein Q4D79_05915, partial [Propionibacteriaceae bacterium]|nr:hypothetical protein [Propionibacteriaceae bacterium]
GFPQVCGFGCGGGGGCFRIGFGSGGRGWFGTNGGVVVGRWWCVVVAGVLVAGCGGGSGAVAPVEFSTGPVPSVVSVAPASSLVVVSPEPSETFTPEQQEAADTVKRFFEILHRLESDPDAPVDELADITMGQTKIVFMSSLADIRQAGHKAIGYVITHIVSAEEAVDGDEGRTVTILACTDSTNDDLVDQDTGESVLDETRAYYVHWHIDVVYSQYYGWQVGNMTSQRGEPCKK